MEACPGFGTGNAVSYFVESGVSAGKGLLILVPNANYSRTVPAFDRLYLGAVQITRAIAKARSKLSLAAKPF